MLQESVAKNVGEEGEIVVYEGRLTALVTKDLGLAVPRYTECVGALRVMGAIRQLRRGGGNSPSQWELIREPTLQEYEAYVGEAKKKEDEGNPPDEFEILQQQIRSLDRRLTGLESAIGLR
jgi:hypothetical protein